MTAGAIAGETKGTFGIEDEDRTPYNPPCEIARHEFNNEDEVVAAALEIVERRSRKVRDGEDLRDADGVVRPPEVMRVAALRLSSLTEEAVIACWLTTRFQVLGWSTVGEGSVDRASLYPRRAVRQGLAHNAAGAFFFHNHPSGDCKPSRSDHDITEKLSDALDLFDIKLHEHFVVTGKRWHGILDAVQGVVE